jgi:hypothetical protein
VNKSGEAGASGRAVAIKASREADSAGPANAAPPTPALVMPPNSPADGSAQQHALAPARAADDRLASWLDLLGKAGAGVALALFAGWAIGKFNNSIALALSAERRLSLNQSTEASDDDLAIGLKIKKTGSTRIRLLACDVTIESDGTTPEQLKLLQLASTRASDVLTKDFQISSGDGVALVPEDEVSFQAHVKVPSSLALHIKTVIKSRQMIMEFLPSARPDWSSSIVVLPRSSREADEPE